MTTPAGDSASSDVTGALPAPARVAVVGVAAFPAAVSGVLTRQTGLQFSWAAEEDGGGWREVAAQLTYVPRAQDAGRRLRLTGRPPAGGTEQVRLERGPVRPSPGTCLYQERITNTQKCVGNQGLRVVTYNMLADYYVSRGMVPEEDCPLYAQDIEYRKQFLLAELLGYNADVLCLQEVDDCQYSSYWKPMLEAAGYSGTFAIKTGPTDGPATFWSSKFKLVSTERHVIAELATKDPENADVQKALTENDRLYSSFTELPSVLQVTVLEAAGGEGSPCHRLVVANTHLYWNLATEHLRAIQAGVCLRRVQQVMQRLQAEDAGRTPALVFCGDFNSQPHQSVYRLMTTGTVTVQDFNTNPEEPVPGLTFSHGYHLKSAYGTPEVTSSTHEFTGCLDYVFYTSDRLSSDANRIVPLPTLSEEQLHLPKPTIASDHLALIVDLDWVQ